MDEKDDFKDEKEDYKEVRDFKDVKDTPREAKDSALPDESQFKLLPRITISDNTSEVRLPLEVG